MADALEQDQRPSGELGEAFGDVVAGGCRSLVPCTTITGQRTLAQTRLERHADGAVAADPAGGGVDEGLGLVSCPQPTQSSICLVECGSMNIF